VHQGWEIQQQRAGQLKEQQSLRIMQLMLNRAPAVSPAVCPGKTGGSSLTWSPPARPMLRSERGWSAALHWHLNTIVIS